MKRAPPFDVFFAFPCHYLSAVRKSRARRASLKIFASPSVVFTLRWSRESEWTAPGADLEDP